MGYWIMWTESVSIFTDVTSFLQEIVKEISTHMSGVLVDIKLEGLVFKMPLEREQMMMNFESLKLKHNMETKSSILKSRIGKH